MNTIKKIILYLTFSTLSSPFAFASIKAPPLSKKETAALSYAIGFEMGQAFNDNNVPINISNFTKGVKEGVLNSKTPYMSKEKVAAVLENFQNKTIHENQKILKITAKKNLKKGKTFLKENVKQPGILRLKSGMEYKILQSGAGHIKPKITSTVVLSYVGKHLNGKTFDESQESTFKVDTVIAGWQQILPMMKVGDHWKIYVPSHLAYGPEGALDIIGPNETIVYDIHLLKVLN